MTPDQRFEVYKLAYSSIILHLSDQVLSKEGKSDSTVLLWKKLEEMYLFKTLATNLFLLERLFGFMIDPLKKLEDKLDVFNKLVQGITNIGEKLPEEYKVVILLNAIREKYREVKNAIKYARDTLTPKIVVDLDFCISNVVNKFQGLSCLRKSITKTNRLQHMASPGGGGVGCVHSDGLYFWDLISKIRPTSIYNLPQGPKRNLLILTRDRRRETLIY